MAISVHAARRPVSQIAAFAEEVLGCAAAGDPAAQAIAERAADELALTAATAVHCLNPSRDTVIPVALGGRVLTGSELLRRLVTDRLRIECPQARPAVAKGTPLDGACRLATALTAEPYESLVHVYREAHDDR